MRKIALAFAAAVVGLATTAALAAPASAADAGMGCPPAGPGTGWTPYQIKAPGIYAGGVVYLNEPMDLNQDGYVCYATVRTDLKKGLQYIVYIDNSLPYQG